MPICHSMSFTAKNRRTFHDPIEEFKDFGVEGLILDT